jgi:hypothetical protein
MPPLPDVPGVVKVDLWQAYGNNKRILNRIHFGFTGSLSVSDAMAWAATIDSYWDTSIFHPDHSLQGVLLTDLTTTSGAVGYDYTTHAGTFSGTPLPAEVAMSIEYLIARRYRGGKPKSFLTGCITAMQHDEETWDDAHIASRIAGWDTFLANSMSHAPAAVGTVRKVSVSYYSGFHVVTSPITGRARNVPTVRTTPVVDDITGYRGDPHIASQRRRSQGSL